MPTRTVICAITLLGCLTLSVNLNAQAGGDVADQIKQLQQQATDAQMKNDVSWAQQHLADGFIAGHSWGQWQTKDEFIKDLQSKTNQWKSGVFLLFIYSLGLAVPFLLTSLFVERFLSFSKGFRNSMRVVEVVGGAVMIVVGALILSNQFAVLSRYLTFLDRFSI